MKKLIYLVVLISFSSCEKIDLDSINSRDNNFTIKVNGISQEPYTRATNLNLVSRISLALINSTTKKTYHQTSDDNDFGTFNLKVDKGIYQLIVVGHNGTNTATINTDKITFGTGNKITDTFLITDTINTEENNTISLELKRCVAAIQVIPTDSYPSELKELKFYYTGGSSTLHPDGYGCVNSKQTEYRNVGNSYILYSFPKITEDNVNLTISDADGIYNLSKTITNIPIKVGYITKINIPIFDGIQEVDIKDIQTTITINNTEWETIEYTSNN